MFLGFGGAYLEEMEHGEEFAWWQKHVVTEPSVGRAVSITVCDEAQPYRSYSPSNNRIMHHWLVWLVLEIAIPATLKLWRRPFPHIPKLLLSRSDFDTSFDSIGCQGASTVEVPLIEHFFLNLFVATNEVVE